MRGTAVYMALGKPQVFWQFGSPNSPWVTKEEERQCYDKRQGQYNERRDSRGPHDDSREETLSGSQVTAELLHRALCILPSFSASCCWHHDSNCTQKCYVYCHQLERRHEVINQMITRMVRTGGVAVQIMPVGNVLIAWPSLIRAAFKNKIHNNELLKKCES